MNELDTPSDKTTDCASLLRRLAGPEDGTPEGRLAVGVTASIGTMQNGLTYRRYGNPELRMKHYVRLRAALLALADELERTYGHDRR